MIDSGYNIFRMKQLIPFIALLFCSHLALAKPPVDNTYTVPPDEKKDENNYVIRPQWSSEAYHLLPGPSVTLAFSPVYSLDQEEFTHWGAVHYSPWMDATQRVQVGASLRSDTIWFEGAYHVLPTRNRYRFYYGGGLSVLINSEARLAPLSKIDNYFLMGVGGWEAQIQKQGSLRLEAGYHQGTEDQFLKALLGYTYHF